MENKLILTEGANPNYLAKICRIGKVTPIENSDHLVTTVVNGFTMVVSNDIKEGDIVIYIPVETVISDKFLSINNLYEISEWKRNSNASEVGLLINQIIWAKTEGRISESEELMKQAKSKVGFFNKSGRVRIVKLRGVSSEGFITKPETLIKYNPDLANIDWESALNTEFNFVGDDEFCKKFVPPIKKPQEKNPQKRYNKAMKKLKRFDRLVEGQFAFHYDTVQLGPHIMNLSPEDSVTISVKMHGTSIVLSKVLVKKKLSIFEKVKKFFGGKVEELTYGSVYSSRKDIKNRYINHGNPNSYYDIDIYDIANSVFEPYLENGMTIYGEVVGYLEGSSTMIQKNHDYGCKVGQWKLMPYRITETDKLGNKKEWNLMDVDAWTHNLVKEHPELEEHVQFLTILYHGKLGDLYPDLDVSQDWHENLLQRMKDDKDNFGMELKEPMCHLYEQEALAAKSVLDKAIANGESAKAIKKLTAEYKKYEAMRAPREGLVIRIDDDKFARAWKLKTDAHYHIEAAQHDAGEVDMEEAESENVE